MVRSVTDFRGRLAEIRDSRALVNWQRAEVVSTNSPDDSRLGATLEKSCRFGALLAVLPAAELRYSAYTPKPDR